ncbi:radical SAM protein [Spirochaetota bacterium]
MKQKDPFELYNSCILCGKKCGADRNKSEHGYCGLSSRLKISSILPHHGEEPIFSGHRGSGTIFFSGCNLQCIFCQNHQISHGQRGSYETSGSFLHRAKLLLEMGVHNLNFVSPTPYIPYIIELVKALHEKKMHPITVYNTGGYDNPEIVPVIDPYIDVYMPDAKYSYNELGEKLSGAENYADINKAFLIKIFETKGSLVIEKGIIKKGICIRHLVLPGYTQNSIDIIDFIADNFGSSVYLSLMSQYSPQYEAYRDKNINRCLSFREYDRVVDRAVKRGLDNAFIQQLSSRREYLPDFEKDDPF